MTDNASTRFEMRAANEWLRKLDGWRREQPDLPSRAEAIRRLVELGMTVQTFHVGDIVSMKDGRSGTIVKLDNLKPLTAWVDFESESDEFDDEGEAVPLGHLILDFRNT